MRIVVTMSFDDVYWGFPNVLYSSMSLLSSQGKQENSYNYLFLVGVSRYLCLFQHFCYIIDRSKRETKQSNDSSNCLPGWRPAVCLIHIVLFDQPFTISLGDHVTAYVGCVDNRMKKEKFNIHD